MNPKDLPKDFTIRDDAHEAFILSLSSLERETAVNPLYRFSSSTLDFASLPIDWPNPKAYSNALGMVPTILSL